MLQIELLKETNLTVKINTNATMDIICVFY